MTNRRQIFSAALLAIILPAILLPSFHRHARPADSDCVDCCSTHAHWHIGQNGAEKCLICQFVSLPWIEAEASVDLSPLWDLSIRAAAPVQSLLSANSSIESTRAPPAVSC